MQERSTERQWGRKCTQKSDRRMRYMQKNGNVKRKLNWSMRNLRGKLRRHMLKHNWPSDTGPGGNRTPDRPWPTVLHLLSGTLTGEKRIFPKKYHFSLFDFSKIVIKFRPPCRGLRKHRLSLYSRRLSLYSPIRQFSQKSSKFLGKLASRNCAHTLWVRLDRNISSNNNNDNNNNQNQNNNNNRSMRDLPSDSGRKTKAPRRPFFEWNWKTDRATVGPKVHSKEW